MGQTWIPRKRNILSRPHSSSVEFYHLSKSRGSTLRELSTSSRLLRRGEFMLLILGSYRYYIGTGLISV